MKHKLLPFLIGIFVCSYLFGHQQVFAENSVNNSVFEFYEQQDSQEKNDQKSDEQAPKMTNESPSSDGKVGVTAWDYIKTIFILIFVIALLITLLKWLQKKGNVSPKLQTVKTLGGATLGGNRSVQMVKVGNSILVVGVGENVQLLKEINNETEIEEILQAYNQRIEQMVQPKDLLTKLTHVWKKIKTNSDFDQNSSFKEEFEKQLHEMKVQRKTIFQEHLKKGSKEE